MNVTFESFCNAEFHLDVISFHFILTLTISNASQYNSQCLKPSESANETVFSQDVQTLLKKHYEVFDRY